MHHVLLIDRVKILAGCPGGYDRLENSRRGTCHMKVIFRRCVVTRFLFSHESITIDDTVSFRTVADAASAGMRLLQQSKIGHRLID